MLIVAVTEIASLKGIVSGLLQRIEKLESESQAQRETSIGTKHDLRAFKWFAGAMLLLLAACMPFALSHLYWA